MENKREDLDGAPEATLPEPTLQEPEAQPVETEAVEPEQKAQGSSVDVESLINELRADNAAIREELKRTKQSFRDTGDSIVKRVREEVAKRREVIDDLVKDGTLTREEASVRIANLRDRIESEVLADSASAQSATPASGGKVSASDAEVFNAAAEEIFRSSGLAPTDPELSLTTGEIPPVAPREAIKIYRERVAKAVESKRAREAKAKQAALAKAKASAPIVNTNGGSTSAPIDKEKEIQRLLANPPMNPKEMMAWKKRLEELGD